MPLQAARLQIHAVQDHAGVLYVQIQALAEVHTHALAVPLLSLRGSGSRDLKLCLRPQTMHRLKRKSMCDSCVGCAIPCARQIHAQAVQRLAVHLLADAPPRALPSACTCSCLQHCATSPCNTHRHSQAPTGVRRHCTHRHSQALSGTHRHSQALLPPLQYNRTLPLNEPTRAKHQDPLCCAR